jgi:hypothetical protein
MICSREGRCETKGESKSDAKEITEEDLVQLLDKKASLAGVSISKCPPIYYCIVTLNVSCKSHRSL